MYQEALIVFRVFIMCIQLHTVTNVLRLLSVTAGVPRENKEDFLLTSNMLIMHTYICVLPYKVIIWQQKKKKNKIRYLLTSGNIKKKKEEVTNPLLPQQQWTVASRKMYKKDFQLLSYLFFFLFKLLVKKNSNFLQIFRHYF